MTNEQYLAWLASSDAVRIVLVEVGARVGGVEVTRYLSTSPYVTKAGEVPANQPYDASLVADDIVTNEQLALDGSVAMSVGEVGVNNADWRLDSWLQDVWTNRPIKIFVGDPSWPRADFQLVFNGLVANIGSKSRTSLNLKIRDKLQQLNTAISEVKLGGETTNKDALLPLIFGEVHNITPLLVNPGQLEYQFHIGAAERIIEVRDNGVPVVITPNVAAGKFKLNQSPAGAITASVQGAKPAAGYTNTVAGVVKLLATSYGKVQDRFTAADLDLTNLNAFDVANPAPVGLPVTDRTNVLVACQQLAASVGAQVTMSRVGQLQLHRIHLQGLVPTFAITPDHILERTLAISSYSDVQASVKLGYCKNWTMQPGLLTALSATDKELFNTEWLTSTQYDGDVMATYRLTAEPEQVDTLLLRRSDADAEALRRLAIVKQPRTTFQFESTAQLTQLQLGQAVSLKHPRFNLEAGKAGMVVSLSTRWAKGRVTVGVMI